MECENKENFHAWIVTRDYLINFEVVLVMESKDAAAKLLWP